MANAGTVGSGLPRLGRVGLSLRGTARDSAIIGGWTIISRGTGFLRMAVAAAVLGPTYFGNILQATSILPAILFEFLAGPLLGAILVPALVAKLDSGDEAGARRLAGQFLLAVMLLFGGAAILVAATAPWWAQTLVLGVDEADRARAVRVASLLALFFVPQVFLYGVAAVGVAAQQARRKFALAAAAPAFENIGMILTLVVGAVVYGTGLEVSAVTDAHVLLLGTGAVLAVVAHAGLEWFGAWRAGFVLVPRLFTRDPELHSMFDLARTSLAGATAVSSRYFVLIVAVGTVPGAVIALRIAQVLVQLPVSVVARPISVALLPRLARFSQTEDDVAAFHAQYESGVRMVLTLAVPAALGLIALAFPIARAIAIGQMATPEAVMLVAVAVGTLALSVVGESLFEVGRQATYSLRDARGVLVASVLRVLLVLPAIAAGTFTDGALRLGIACLGVTFADVTAALLLDRRVQRTRVARGAPRQVALTLLASVLAAAAAGGVAQALWRMAPGPAMAVGGLVAAAAVGAGAYGLTRHLIARPNDARVAVTQVVRYARAHDVGTLILAMVISAALGAGVALAGPLAAGALLGAAVLVAAFVWPPVAVGLYLLALPILGGIERGELLPLVRPHEALHFGLFAAVALRAFVSAPPRALPPLPRSAPARAVLVLAFFASVVPLLWFAIRHGSLPVDEVLTVVPLWRYALLFFMVRLAIRTPHEARLMLLAILASGAALAVITVAQVLDVPAVIALLATYWRPLGDASVLGQGRGTATLTSSIATGDYLAICVAIVVAWLTIGGGPRRLLWAAAPLFVAGTIATAQFSAFIGLGLVLSVVALLSGEAVRFARLSAPAVLVAGAALWPALSVRFIELSRGELPPSWVVRWDNVTTYYLPSLQNFGWILGVRPQTALPAIEQWRDTVWLESGYLWLLWVGGLPLLAAFAFFAITFARAAIPIARSRRDAVGVAATALCAWLGALTFLLLFDPHLTMRGAGDLLFVLGALATQPRPRAVLLAGFARVPHGRPLPASGNDGVSSAPAWPPLEPALSSPQRLAKRALDVVLATIALVVLAPLLLVVAAAIRLTSGRPILFRQVRVGVERRPFVLYKFRTMSVGGDDSEVRALNSRELLEDDPTADTADGVFKLNDRRVTPIGHWLRRTSIDELPQLLNVLRGDMSLVGPRPVLDWELALFEPHVHQRFAVPPGLTGRWQVGGRNRVTMRRMLEMDVEYVRNWSLLSDISILMRTPAAVLRGDGAR